MDSLNEIYESNWVGHDLLYVQAQNIEMLWQDFSHKLGDQVLIPLNTYQSQFPEMRKKIDKRGRKLVDYDSQRHNFQSLQGNPKKRDEIKVTKARESLEEAKRTYELLNSELHDELPALYDSRVLFLVTNLQTLFAAEQVFHVETAKVYAELEAIVDKLATDCQRGTYTLKKSSPKSPKTPTSNSKIISSAPSSPTSVVGEKEKSSYLPEQGPTETQMTGDHKTFESCGATTDNLPPGVLYRVKATYKYNREDVDELSFDVGEIIRVVEYDDPEEQEEGWLMGVKEGTGEKGMFPANFTRPL
ncbi:hypothetical protein B7P43_G01816 [Cryptotermes secundus]|uniref:Uncharacterized protein n=2 Tax=Cryptotermes secundus TaxID=105785 RepID=A0A2J7PP96_9NEOP|nr:hypothetical protein B7P43_G01816 [Cryptotermes secundus]